MSALSACGGVGEERPRDELVFGFGLGPRTWDPHPESRAFVYGWYSLVYNGLLTTDDEGNLLPDLAESWTQTTKAVTLTLRQGVTFSDGTPFDSSVVAWNITKQQNQPGTQPVLKRIDHVETPDAYTVILHLAAPAPSLLNQLASFAGLMVSPNVSQPDLEAGTPAGTGPYVLDSGASQANTTYVYRQNENYVGERPAKFKTVTGRVISDDVSRTNALLSGRIDIGFLSAAQANDVEGRLGISSARSFVQVLLLLDTVPGSGPLGDPRVREAIWRAIDRNAFDRAVNFERSHPQTEILEPPLPGTLDGYNPYPYDPERARELIAESGYKDITLSLPVSGGFKAGAEALAAMLDQVGIKMNLVAVAPGQDTAGVLAGRFDSTYTYIPDVNPDSIYNKFLGPKSPFNPFGVTDPAIDTAQKTAIGSPQGSDAQVAAYSTMMHDLSVSARIIPIARVDSAIGYDETRVTGVKAWSGVTGFPVLNDVEPRK